MPPIRLMCAGGPRLECVLLGTACAPWSPSVLHETSSSAVCYAGECQRVLRLQAYNWRAYVILGESWLFTTANKRVDV